MDIVTRQSHSDVKYLTEKLRRLNDLIDEVTQIDGYPGSEIDKMEEEATVLRVLVKLAVKELKNE